MQEFEALVRGVRLFGVMASIAYFVFFIVAGAVAILNIHPEHRGINTANAVIGAIGFALGLCAWFPRKQMYLVDRKEFRRRPPTLYGVTAWIDGKVLVVKTYAVAAVALSMAIFAVLVIMTLIAY